MKQNQKYHNAERGEDRLPSEEIELNSKNWIITIPNTPKINQNQNQNQNGTEQMDWSTLNAELLEQILRRLDPVDHHRFSLVCSSWRSIQAPHRTCGDAPMQSNSPWLVNKPRFSMHCYFFNSFDACRHAFALSDLFAHACRGSVGSWLIMKGFAQRYIYNPFTCTRIAMPGDYLDPKLIAVADTPEFVVLSFNFCMRRFRYFRRNVWSELAEYSMGDRGYVYYVVSVGQKFYAMSNRGMVADIDIDRAPLFRWIEEAEPLEFDLYSEHVYPVESCGELWVVLATCRLFTEASEMKVTRIFRFDAAGSTWVRAESTAQDRVFFLKEGGSSSVRGGVGGALVYTAGRDSVGVFDVDQGTGTVHCDCEKAPGTWIMPRLLSRDREPKWWVPLRNVAPTVLMCCGICALIAIVFMVILFAPNPSANIPKDGGGGGGGGGAGGDREFGYGYFGAEF